MRVVRIYHAGRDGAHRERDRALVRAGVEVTLLVPTEWPGPDDGPEAEPFDVVELPVVRRGDVNRHRYASARAVLEVVERVRPDLVDLHEEPFSSVVRQVLTKLPERIPVVSYAAQNLDKRFPPPFAQWERSALMRLSGIYPCTAQAASVVAGKGFTGPVEVLPLAPSPQIVAGAQPAPSEGVRLLHVGRLVPEKGACDAVEVLAALRSPGIDASLTIVGDGPERAPALERARDRGVADAVELHPWASAADLARFYADAHVLLAPSRRTRTWVEQFGRMVVEAQAAGVVVAGYATGALPEVAGTAALLVAEGDTAALAAAVASCVAEPGTWARLRADGLAASAGRSWDAVARGQVRLYERAIAAPTTRRRVRPNRAAARQRFGPPAEVAGGGRPFALPVLRDDTVLTRAAAATVDALSRREAPVPSAPPARLKVVYLDHVARMSGGEVALARLITALPDVDAHVILAEDGPLRAVLERSGATVEVLPLDERTRDARRREIGTIGNLRLIASTLTYTLRLTGRLRSIKPDLVHTNSLKSGFYGAAAARLARRPVIWHLRDRIADDYLPRRAVWLTRAMVRTLPDLVICNSHETLRTARIQGRGAAVVASPVIHDPYQGSVPRRPYRDAPVIGILGRLAPWKGQDVFLRAFAAVARDHQQVRGRVIGSAMFGEDEFASGLRALAAELGVADRVTFVGHTDEVERELGALDVLVHASVTPEPFGQVIVEGMAAGLAVIAAAAGGPLEIVTDGVDGLLVPPGDVVALAAAMRRLVDDAALRDRLGAGGAVRARDFSPDRIGAAVQAIYRDLLVPR